jgi:cell division protease FtsH
MVCELGMSPLGPLTFRASSGGWDQQPPSMMSEEMARRVDEEVRAVVMRGYDRARRMVSEHRLAACAMADRLLVEESLDAKAIREVLAANGVN